MQNSCNKCGKLFMEGDWVSVVVESTYHVLKSKIAYALDKDNMTACNETLRHVDCLWTQGMPRE